MGTCGMGIEGEGKCAEGHPKGQPLQPSPNYQLGSIIPIGGEGTHTPVLAQGLSDG